jgi:large subunit ribosomal protein L21
MKRLKKHDAEGRTSCFRVICFIDYSVIPRIEGGVKLSVEAYGVDAEPQPWYRTEVMYAIIESGGKQYRVAEGDVIRCDLIANEVGSDITFDRVVLAETDEAVKVGSPILDGASVTGTVLRQLKDKKILVFRYKPKKRVRKLNGHRQPYAEVKITKITLP